MQRCKCRYRQPVFNFFAGSNVNIFQDTAVQDNTLQNPEKIGSSKRKRCSYLLFIQATKNKNIEAFLSMIDSIVTKHFIFDFRIIYRSNNIKGWTTLHTFSIVLLLHIIYVDPKDNVM